MTTQTSFGNDVNNGNLNSLNTNNREDPQNNNSTIPYQNLTPIHNSNHNLQPIIPHNNDSLKVPNNNTSTAVGRVIGQKSSHATAVSGYDTNSSNAGSENSPPHNKLQRFNQMQGGGSNFGNNQKQN